MRSSRPDTEPGAAWASLSREAQPRPAAAGAAPEISIVLPARDEAAIVASSVARVCETLEGLGRSFEVIVADSASSDGTGEIAAALGRSEVRVVRAQQPGKGAAVSLGLRAATGRYVGFLDCDLEIDPAELPRLVAALDEGADAAIASKVDAPGERPWRRRFSTALYNGAVRALFGTAYADHQAGMKLFQGAAAQAARAAESSGWFWDTEVLVAIDRQGRRVREIPVRTSPGREGRLSVAVVAAELLRELLRLYISGPDAGGNAEAEQAPGQRLAWDWVTALACSVAIALLLHPELVVSGGTPAGYDLSGHFYPFSQAVTRLLRGGPLHDWSTGWFAGYPVFYFYFPLGVFITAALTPLLGVAAAYKTMSVVGVVAFPLAVCWLLRELRLGRVVAAATIVAACGFLCTRYFDLGANLRSTLGGEFSYSISFTLSIAYLAAMVRAARRPRHLPGVALAAVLLAATALSHAITTAAVVLAVAPLLLDRERRPAVLGSWGLGFLLAAFWALPFLARSGFMWPSFGTVEPAWRRALPRELVPVLPAALIGVWLMRRSRAAGLLLWLGLLAITAATIPQHRFLALRFLPYWYLALYLLAGLAVGALAERALRRRSVVFALLALLLAAAPLHLAVRSRYLGSWAALRYGGLERNGGWPEVQALSGALRAQPPGRVYWQDDDTLFSSLGSRHLLALLPYWAPGHDAIGGLWVESSPTAGTVASIDRQITAATGPAGDVLWPRIARELGGMGVRYFVTARAAAGEQFGRVPGARKLWSGERFTLFQIPAAPLVQTPAGVAPASQLYLSDREIRFHAAALHVPHLVAVSYFPNWEAEGAAGPIQVGTFMGVVPTRPDVRLRFRPGALELLGAILSIFGLAIAAGMAGLELGRSALARARAAPSAARRALGS